MMNQFRRGMLAVALLGLLSAPPQTMAAELPPLHRGVSTFPWLYRAKTIGGDPQHFDWAHLFPYRERFTPADFATLRRTGADLIRIPVEPTPLVVSAGPDRAALIRTIVAAARRVTAAGMTAIVDLHPNEGLKGWGAAAIIASPERWDAYVGAVTELAAALAASGDGRLALELMNEPGGGYGGQEGRYWIYLQPAFLAAVRKVAPSLPVIVSGDRGGGIDGLVRLDAGKLDDPAVIYSFHYYDPMVITHQGASWGSQPYRRYLEGIAYPPDPGQDGEVLAAFKQRVGAAVQSPAEAGKIVADGSSALAGYATADEGPARIAADFAKVTAWAKRSGIPPGRILLGEFGVLRPGASDQTAVSWTHDVRTAAEKAGFAWSYWNYAPFDENGTGFSMLQMHGPTPNRLDPTLLSAGLGLKAP